MAKFRYTDTNIKKAASLLVSKMIADKQSSIEITSLSDSIRLPGSGFIGSTKVIVSLTTDSELLIKRADKKDDLGYKYPLDDITLQWIKINKIPIHQKL